LKRWTFVLTLVPTVFQGSLRMDAVNAAHPAARWATADLALLNCRPGVAL
jgi:hypothetical protein